MSNLKFVAKPSRVTPVKDLSGRGIDGGSLVTDSLQSELTEFQTHAAAIVTDGRTFIVCGTSSIRKAKAGQAEPLKVHESIGE